MGVASHSTRCPQQSRGLGVGRMCTCGKWHSSGLKVLVCRGCGDRDTKGLTKKCAFSRPGGRV